MVGKKLMFILGVLALSLLLAGINACEEPCVPQTYDSGWTCMNFGIDSSTKLSNYVVDISGDAWYYETSSNTICGKGFYYVDEGTGEIKIETPSLPFSGTYDVRFYYGIGSPNDIGTEDFKVRCNSDEWIYFYDDDDSSSDTVFRHSDKIECDMSEGVNTIEIKSLDTGSVHFKKFRIEGELTCPEEYCGDEICNGGETCETCEQDCGVCPVEPYCGDGIVNQESEECDGEENCTSECKWEEEDDDDETWKKPFEWNFCESSWKCSGWSECLNGIMTRDCYDENHCEIEYNKPLEQSGCSVLSKVYAEENGNYIWILVGIIIFLILLIVLVNLLK